jgi:hypothetical protein
MKQDSREGYCLTNNGSQKGWISRVTDHVRASPIGMSAGPRLLYANMKRGTCANKLLPST